MLIKYMSATCFKLCASASAPFPLLNIATLQVNLPPDVLHVDFKIIGIDSFIKGCGEIARGRVFSLNLATVVSLNGQNWAFEGISSK